MRTSTTPAAPGSVRRRVSRHGPRGAAVGLLCAVLAALSAAPAQAAEYRYWSFWVREEGSWSYATKGPSLLRPSDGDVLGFRFAVSRNSGEAAKPRTQAKFEAVCADTAPKTGTKRVALAIDFGTRADAPPGGNPPERRTVCARVSPDASAADALAATAEPLRYNSSALLCAIAGYPKSGCGEPVADGEKDTAENDGENDGAPDKDTGASTASGESGDGDTVLGVVAGVGAVVVLATGALWQSRRRRR